MKTELVETKKLEQFLTRELRQNVVDDIKKSILENGFLMGHNLTVVGDKIIDGNHRHKAAVESGILELPCIIYDENEVNIYRLAEQLNTSNDTYAKQDLFDVLYKIEKLKKDNLSQREIGSMLEWGKDNISRYSILINNISPSFLERAKQSQSGRGESVSPTGYNFTERWFRDSGLYDLNEEFQLLFFEKFKVKNGYRFICNYAAINQNDLPL